MEALIFLDDSLKGEVQENSVSVVLRNELILKELLSFLTLQDLKMFRQMSHMLNQNCLPFMRKKSGFIDFSREEEIVQKYLQTKAKHKKPNDYKDYKYLFWNDITLIFKKKVVADQMDKLANVISASSYFPCSKILIGTKLLNQLVGCEISNRFLKAISATITELEIYLWCDRVAAHQATWSEVVFPNLKSLKIIISNVLTDPPLSTRECFKNGVNLRCFGRLLGYAPNLRKFSIENLEHGRCLDHFLDSIENQVVSKIKDLELEGKFSEYNFSQLDKKEFTLQRLVLTIRNFGSNLLQVNLTSFLKSQSKTLKELELGRLMGDENIVITPPRLENLNVLKVSYSYLENDTEFPNLVYAENFPALKKLVLTGHPSSLIHFFNFKLKPLNTLETLEISNVVEDLENAEIIHQAARIFPNIKTLSVSGGIKVMQAVDASMKNIEELTISTNKQRFDDMFRIFTGYSEYEVMKVKHLWSNVGEVVMDGKKEPLSFLQNVNLLRLDNDCITNMICQLGLMKLRALRVLVLRQTVYDKIDKQVMCEMQKRFAVTCC